VLSLTDAQVRLLIAMCGTAVASINQGCVWVAGSKHRVRDLLALRAAGLVCSAEVGRDSGHWVKRWQLTAIGIAEAQRSVEQTSRTDPDGPIPGRHDEQT